MIGATRTQVPLLIALGLLGSVVWPAPGPVHSGTRSVDQIAQAESVNRTIVQLIEARLQLAQWNWVQCKSLRNRGFASWLDVAQQELLVAALQERHKAASQFADFLRDLSVQVSRARATIGSEDDLRLDGMIPRVAVTLPGSVHLIGSLALDHIVPVLGARLLGPFVGADWDEDQLGRELVRAEKNVTRTAQRAVQYRQLAGKFDCADRLKQTELALRVARAELDFVRIQYQVNRRRDRGGTASRITSKNGWLRARPMIARGRRASPFVRTPAYRPRSSAMRVTMVPTQKRCPNRLSLVRQFRALCTSACLASIPRCAAATLGVAAAEAHADAALLASKLALRASGAPPARAAATRRERACASG